MKRSMPKRSNAAAAGLNADAMMHARARRGVIRARAASGPGRGDRIRAGRNGAMSNVSFVYGCPGPVIQ